MSREKMAALADAAADLATVTAYHAAGMATAAHVRRAQDTYAAAARRSVK